jgi:folate-binding protein YgfZ
MNTAWIQFLHAQPPAISNLKPNETGWLVLSLRASIRAAGIEAADFLQAMLTQEILALSPTQAARSALCNAKGRILSILTVHPEQTPQGLAYHLTVPQDLCADLFKTLKLYVLRRKITLTLADDWGFIGIINPSHDLLKTLAIDPAIDHEPPTPQKQIPLTNGLIATWENLAGSPRLSIQGPLDPLALIAQRLTTIAPIPVAQAVWDCAEMHDGLPEIHPATYLQFVPQWVNLDRLSAVSFKKGCYPGQEVIARLHYLGKSNRRMLMGHTTHPQLLPAGTRIYSANEPQTEVGEIVRSALCSSNGTMVQQFLAVIRLNHAHEALMIENHPCALYSSPFVENSPAQTH